MSQAAVSPITRAMAHLLSTEWLNGAAAERWYDVAGMQATQALHELGLVRRGDANMDECAECLYLTAAGERAADVAWANTGGYLTADAEVRLNDERFAVAAAGIAEAIGRLK